MSTHQSTCFCCWDDLSYGLNTLGPLCLWQCFSYECSPEPRVLLLLDDRKGVGLGSGGAGGRINDDVRSPLGQFPGERVHNSFPATLVVGGRVKIFFAPSGRLMVACQGLSDITSNLLKHTENTPLLSFAPVKCLISGKFHWAKQAIIDAVQKNEQKRQICQKQFTTKVGIGF